MPADVRDYYERDAMEEWRRLERHRTELAVTLRALAEYLPAAPARVLDVGGGPGRYAIELARRGYVVTLLDLAEANLRLARAKAAEAGVTLAEVRRADARDLGGAASASQDAVLLMGPLYHLLDAAERARALAEATRVLRPDGVLCAAFITRFAWLRDAAANVPEWVTADPEYADRVLATGVHDGRVAFTAAYFAHPDEITPLMEGAGLATLALVGCEGVVARQEALVNALTGREWDCWVDLNYRLGHDPSLRGAADHLLYVGRKGG